MATIASKIADIKAETGYVTNSLYLKSSDPSGAVYKYLISTNGVANRKEKFFELDPTEDETVSNWVDRTVESEILVEPAQ